MASDALSSSHRDKTASFRPRETSIRMSESTRMVTVRPTARVSILGEAALLRRCCPAPGCWICEFLRGPASPRRAARGCPDSARARPAGQVRTWWFSRAGLERGAPPTSRHQDTTACVAQCIVYIAIECCAARPRIRLASAASVKHRLAREQRSAQQFPFRNCRLVMLQSGSEKAHERSRVEQSDRAQYSLSAFIGGWIFIRHLAAAHKPATSRSARGRHLAERQNADRNRESHNTHSLKTVAPQFDWGYLRSGRC